jgi:hypothetical protein
MDAGSVFGRIASNQAGEENSASLLLIPFHHMFYTWE